MTENTTTRNITVPIDNIVIFQDSNGGELYCVVDDDFINLTFAAPDLLEALETIIASGEIPNCYSSPLVKNAEMAIAKARGKS